MIFMLKYFKILVVTFLIQLLIQIQHLILNSMLDLDINLICDINYDKYIKYNYNKYKIFF